MTNIKKQQQFIPSKLDAINKHVGGYYRPSLSLLVAPPNDGKTTALCDEAMTSFKNGYNVIFITLEMTPELIMEKMLANLSGIPMGDSMLKSINIRDQMNAQGIEGTLTISNGGRGDIINFGDVPESEERLDIETIISRIEAHNSVKNFYGATPDIIFIDGLNSLFPHNALNIRQSAIKRNAAIVMSYQASRNGLAANYSGNTLHDVADLIFTAKRSPKNVDSKVIYTYDHKILKNRFGPNGTEFETTFDFSLMRMNNNV